MVHKLTRGCTEYLKMGSLNIDNVKGTNNWLISDYKYSLHLVLVSTNIMGDTNTAVLDGDGINQYYG